MTTINTNSNNAIRLTVRIETTDDNRSIDLTIPSSSQLAEIFEEIIALAGAPLPTAPWEAVTAAGQPLPLFEPLSECYLTHGDIIILRLQQEETAPVLLDTAESLAAETTATGTPTGTALTAATCGYLGLMIFCLGFTAPQPIIIPLAARMFLVTAACLGMLWWTRKPLFAILVTLSCGLVGIFIITGEQLTPIKTSAISATDFASNWGLALITGGGFALLSALILHMIVPIATTITALITTAGFVVVAGIGALLYRPSALTSTTPTWSWLPNAAGLVVALGIILLALCPTLAIKISGIKIPTVPSAGQDLSVSDEPLGINHHTNAILTLNILIGLVVGTTLALGPALLIIGLLAPQPSFALALGATTAIALSLHAHRHRQPLTTWALWLSTLSAALSCLLACFHTTNSHWLMTIICIIVVTLLITAPGWAAKISSFQPTTVVWLERSEALCLAACLPLALHIVGLFGLLRGIAA